MKGIFFLEFETRCPPAATALSSLLQSCTPLWWSCRRLMLRLPAYNFVAETGSPPQPGAAPWQRLVEAVAPQFEEQTFALIDASQFLHQWSTWTQALPAVQLFLPIKVNPDEQLLRHVPLVLVSVFGRVFGAERKNAA